MPLSIVRNDITKVRADAIVNSTNEALIMGGLGVDASIHAAAGPALREKLEEIGFCEVGSAVITSGYNIPSCRYIIHAVSPIYIDGKHGEEALLRSCYRSILGLAEEYACGSVAMPILCSGANGYPKTEAYKIATSTARNYLAETGSDIEIIIVIFGKEMVDVSQSQRDEVRHYITDHYKEMNEDALYTKVSFSRRERDKIGVHHRVDAAPYILAAPSAAVEIADEEASRSYADEDRSFADMCAWWMKKKGISVSEFYARSNITKGTFFNIKKHPEQTPKKSSAFACVIGLGLDIEEANDLLMRAGLVLSPYYPMDRIVKKYIEQKKYDIDDINLELFDHDLAILGSVAY